MLDHLDAGAVRRWCATALHELVAAREEIDALNVYPVPDGDTGTNLVLTMESVSAALAAEPGDDLGAVTAAVTKGALLGARGNSGVILSQLLRGMGEVFAAAGTVGPDHLSRALRTAADAAYAAVAQPVEGTILTVARSAAGGAAGGTVAEVLEAACRAAADALARTPEQLPALAQAGVVDAGGRGLCVVLDALLSVATGSSRHVSLPAPVRSRDRSALVAARESGSDEFGYEVQYLLDALDVAGLEEVLAGLGDSLVVVGGNGLWNVHVHVNDVGAAIEAGVNAGRPHRIAVTRFADQYAEPHSAQELAVAGVTGTFAAPARTRAVVAVAPGPGLAGLFAAAGAEVVAGGPSACPSTGELLDAVARTGAAEVVVLPNDGNVHGPAGQAAAEAAKGGREVHVIPTRSPVQGLAALAVHDPDRSFADDAIAMTTAATGTRYAEVTVAVRDAQTSAGACRAGDVLGLIDGDVAVIGTDVTGVAAEVIERMLVSGGELVTVVTGAGCPDGCGDALAATVAAGFPLVDVELHEGGQPHYPVLVGVE